MMWCWTTHSCFLSKSNFMDWKAIFPGSTQRHILLNPQEILKDRLQTCFEEGPHWGGFTDSHSQKHSEHWMFRCPSTSFLTSAYMAPSPPPLTRNSLPPLDTHSDYWKAFPSLEWKSVSSFYQLVLTHDKGQGGVNDCHDLLCHFWNFYQGAQWTRPQTGGKWSSQSNWL